MATEHDQHGWKAFAFPISVDGLEIVAALYMVVQRRAGRRTGWLPWIALVVGTAASLAANIAVGGESVIGKILAGWPALSMLIAVKLLFSMIDHGEDGQRTVPDDQRTSADRPTVLGTVPPASSAGDQPSGTTKGEQAGRAGPAGVGPADRPGGEQPSGTAATTASADARAVAHLLPAARAAGAALASAGRPLSRERLADALRKDGHGVSNERASLLMKVLRSEQETAGPGPDAVGGTATVS
ncbi:DUF2637 domain-containing protein [Solwaraspora sp. WMMD792]|uniref:DUF2637 domain-containing protein n=1 Tax=Solwaraspora sp. WMMD792 TaxID=3016099 RepID=UPI00241712C2|nr:DUF2637 domain-containing protein [Solwaraspora sp. WMMD792]MDG4773524.1 DUF2637 domain-containing protein [Solwaraspora sp. WMMD792]